MRPTRRGLGVGAVVVVGFALGATFGARALDAVVVPGVVALVAGGVQLHRADPPAIERSQPRSGHPGEARTVELTVESSVPCRVTDGVGAGLAADDPTAETAGDGRLTYELTLERRGEWTLGPAAVVATDSFGLFVREFTHRVETPVLVYPELYALGGPVGVAQESSAIERQAFDHIREYVPGDSLRDVHWKQSAKRPDGLVVAEYAADERGGVTVGAETHIGSAEAVDAMASATASVASALLDAGVETGVVVPGGRLPERVGERHRRELLELLARTGGGRLDPADAERVDVRVRVAEDGVHVSVDGERERAFGDLAAGVRS